MVPNTSKHCVNINNLIRTAILFYQRRNWGTKRLNNSLQKYLVGKQQSKDLNSGSLAPKTVLLTSKLEVFLETNS